jgi:hypothetical protein
MRDAVAADFARLLGSDNVLTTPADAAVPWEDWFRACLPVADWFVVIAPEIDGLLARHVEFLEAHGGRVLGCSAAAVRLSSDKLALANHWHRLGVRTPATMPATEWPAGRFPCVLKPIDGAGSVATFLATNAGEFADALRAAEAAGRPAAGMIAQNYHPGTAASVAFLIGPREVVPLVPTFQLLSADGRFRYGGAELPIPPDLAARSVAVGRAAVAGVPGLRGFVAVDLVLGPAADGSADAAIEINPRVSMAYIGLRALCEDNLAAALLRAVAGEPVGELRWRPGRVRFRPDGAVEFASSQT